MRIIIIQIVKFFRNCFSLEFDCKKPGRTKSKTPTINMTESNLSIKTPINFYFGAVGENRTLMD